jgi:putative drug exporter of the RND superfamily
VRAGWPSRVFARLVVGLGWAVVPALAVAAFLAWHALPGISALPESGVKALLPSRTAAVDTEREAARLFGSSLLPRIAVVERNPKGIPLRQQRRIAEVAVRLDRGRLPGFPAGSRALPYSNAFGVAPGARERGTTVITYLGFPSKITPGQQRTLADRYAGLVSVPGAPAEATGFIPGSIAQSDAVDDGLFWVTLAAILVTAAILALYLRSLVAPIVVLAAAGLAYVLATHVMAWLAAEIDVEIQNEVEPIVVVLLLAIVTDYSVFLLSGTRGRILAGERSRAAARRATADLLPIIVTAGLLVAAGLATLRLAGIGFVRALGPAMAIVVLVGLAVSVLFVPAAMGLLGRWTFWPGLQRGDTRQPFTARAGARVRQLLAIGTSRRLGAVPTLAIAAVALVAAATGLAQMRLALTPIRGLPSDASAARADREAALGFAGGVIAPTELVLQQRDIGFRTAALKRFGRRLRAEPEVAGVIGAAVPTLPRRAQPVFHSRDGDAVRYFIAFQHHPYASAGIDDLHRLERSMPRLLAGAGLSGTAVGYAGDTAMATETTGLISHDLLVVGIAAVLVNLVLLAVFLRSLVAPVLIVATSLLGIAATLGLTAYVAPNLLGAEDVTYYVPLAVGVLLLSLGTDYNLFIVGRIWKEAEQHDVRTAIQTAVPRAGRAISIAALALAASFATLWIIPIAPFRTFAFAVCVGVLVDAFVVRTLMIPALLAACGNASWWPARRHTGPLGSAAPARGGTEPGGRGLSDRRPFSRAGTSEARATLPERSRASPER